MRGWLIIFAFWGLGVAGNQWLHIPVPSNLLGMLLLVVCLAFGVIKLKTVEAASSFLMRHMLLFFVPIMVGVSQQFDIIAQNPWPILLALTVGTATVMFVTGTIMQRYMQYRHAKDEKGAALTEERTMKNA